MLVQGLEPNLRWRQFTTTIASALQSANARRVHVLGALLADTPHTRPIPVSTSTYDRELMTSLGLAPSTYEGPTGIVGVLADTLARGGLEVLSLWAAVPHYVSHPPCPKATLALLSSLEELLDTALDQGDLPELARAWERGVDELAADDTEVAEYVVHPRGAAGRHRAARGERRGHRRRVRAVPAPPPGQLAPLAAAAPPHQEEHHAPATPATKRHAAPPSRPRPTSRRSRASRWARRSSASCSSPAS